MSETLFNAAKVNLNCSNKLLQLLDDPRELNICGHLIHKAAEFSLKFLLEFYKKEYIPSGSVRQLLNVVGEDDLELIWTGELHERLVLFTGTLDSWKSQCCNVGAGSIDVRSVLIGYKLVSALMDAIAVHTGQYFIAKEIPQSALDDMDEKTKSFLYSHFNYTSPTTPTK